MRFPGRNIMRNTTTISLEVYQISKCNKFLMKEKPKAVTIPPIEINPIIYETAARHIPKTFGRWCDGKTAG